MSPIYEFEGPEGEVIEEFYPMAQAPPLDSTIEREGKTYTRIIEGQMTLCRREMRVEAKSLKRKAHWTSEELRRHKAGGGSFNAKGEAQFSTRRQIEEHVRVHNDENVHGQELSFGEV